MAIFRDFATENKRFFDTLECCLQEALSGEKPTNLSKKSALEAVKLREMGNEFYCRNRKEEALVYYNKSIAIAPFESEELALAFGNRSAVLFHLQKYELCLLDVNRALEGRFPDGGSRKKLLKRKMDCWKLIKVQDEVKLGLTAQGERYNSGQSFNPVEKRVFLVSQMSIDDSDFNYSSFEDPIWSTKFDNPVSPNISSKVGFENHIGGGLLWTAVDDIAPGEILAIEDLYALKTCSETIYAYCTHCAVSCEALIPCPTCTREMYCNKRCRQEAFDSYHRIECKVLSLFSSVEKLDNAILALRVFLIGTKQGSDLIILMNDPDVYDRVVCGRDPEDFQKNNYLLVLQNLRVLKKLDEEGVMNSMKSTIAQLLNALRCADFFENGPNTEERSQSMTDAELFAGFLLYHNLCIVDENSCNRIPIDLHADFIGYGPQSGKRKIGCGISLLRNMANCSCVINCSTVQDKRRLLTYCVAPIKVGEQILTSCEKKTEEYRDCLCKACVLGWPSEEILLRKNNIYLTSNKKIIEEVEKMDEWLIKRLMPNINLPMKISTGHMYKEEELQKAFEFNKNIREYVAEPSRTIMLCEQFIRQCMEKKGNCYILQSTMSILNFLLAD